MTDKITQNDCQGEQWQEDIATVMWKAGDGVPINIELGEHGLYYGTSPAMKGLLVTGESIEQVMEKVPSAIAKMREVGGDDLCHAADSSRTPVRHGNAAGATSLLRRTGRAGWLSTEPARKTVKASGRLTPPIRRGNSVNYSGLKAEASEET